MIAQASNHKTFGRLGQRSNATLRHEEWKLYDDALVDVTRERANAVGFLIGRGLTMNGSLGDSVAYYETVSDTSDAIVSMDGRANNERDRNVFDETGVPVPIIHSHWSVNERTLDSSRKRGASLDVTWAASAAENVWIKANELLFNGGFKAGNDVHYGLTTVPGKADVALTANAWNGVSTGTDNGITCVNELNRMLAAAYAKNFFGPFVVFVSKNIWAAIQRDYSADKGDNTIIERIRAFEDIVDVLPGDQLADNKVVMLDLNRRSITVFIGQDLMNVEYMDHPLNTNMMTYMALASMVKTNANGDAGVVDGTGA